jgi:hypothetical protein
MDFNWENPRKAVIIHHYCISFSQSVADKNCDDEDECGSADDVFTNDGSGDSEERLSSKNEVCPIRILHTTTVSV